MSKKLATIDYVDSKVVWIGTEQPFDGRTVDNALFVNANVIILLAKHTGNRSCSLVFETEKATFQDVSTDNGTVSATFHGKEEGRHNFVLGVCSGWYLRGVLILK